MSNVLPLLTPEEVARILRLTRLQVIRASREGHIPAVRIGRVWRYRPESIQAWLDREERAGHNSVVNLVKTGEAQGLKFLGKKVVDGRVQMQWVDTKASRPSTREATKVEPTG